MGFIGGLVSGFIGSGGAFVLRDAIKTCRAGTSNEEEKVTKLTRWVQSINIPYTKVYFKSLNARISVLFTIPLGFATGSHGRTGLRRLLMGSVAEKVIGYAPCPVLVVKV